MKTPDRHRRNVTRVAVSVLCMLLSAFWLRVASSQSYPSRPIRIIFPIAAGSASNDILGRALTQRLSDALGQQVIVDNRPGANGSIGASMVAKAVPDGYTLVLGYTSAFAIAPAISGNLSYDVVREFVPVARFAIFPYVIAVHPSVPASNVKELIALAKARPGQLNYASSGNGSTPHLCGELFKSMAGVDLVHVPYKAAALAITDLVGGHVQIHFGGVTATLAHFKTGKLRALATTALSRSALLPDVPTVDESGLRGFEVIAWVGVLAPAKTPEAILRRLNDEIAKIMSASEMRSFVIGQGAEPGYMDAALFGAYIRTEISKWGKLAKAVNLKPD